MLNIKFVTDVSNHPRLGPLTEQLREQDNALIEQHNWLVEKANKIDKDRKALADAFWAQCVEILKEEGKLPKHYQVGDEKTMVTFGYSTSTEIFTMDRPHFLSSGNRPGPIGPQ